MTQRQHKGLGRGLNALFEDDLGDDEGFVSAGSQANARQTLGIELLHPGTFQPRHHFDDDKIVELAESLKRHGVIQPILVRADSDNDGQYEIIAGERRWRAAQMAQLHEVPVIIETFSDEQALEVALIENLQREDLNPIDEAAGYKRLLDEHGHTQEKLAEILGKSRSHIANMVRLLNLPDGVQNYLRDGRLSMGHARTLVTVKQPESLARDIIKQNLSVREAEKLAAKGAIAKKKKKSNKAEFKGPDTIALEQRLSEVLGMRVTISPKKSAKGSVGGQVSIEFRDLDQLDDVINRLSAAPASSSRLRA